MRKGPPAVAALTITQKQRAIFTSLVKKRDTGQQESKRIQIILLGSEGHSNAELKRRLNMSINTIKCWRSRWTSSYEELSDLEQQIGQNNFRESDYKAQLLSVVQDRPRSGTPKKFSMAQESSILALACEKPVEHGIEMTDWTHEMLAKVTIEKKIVPSISKSQVRRILKK